MENFNDPTSRGAAVKQLKHLLDEIAALYSEYQQALEQYQRTIWWRDRWSDSLRTAIKTKDDLELRRDQCRFNVPQVCQWMRDMRTAMDEVNMRTLTVHANVHHVAVAQEEMDAKKRAWTLRRTGTEDAIARLRAYLSRPPLRDASGRPTPAGVADYFARLDIAHADYASLTRFPDPPAFPCGKSDCSSRRNERKLEACVCNLRFVFANRNLKTERLRWHPDKWSSVSSGVREEMQEKAREVFVTLDAMYRQSGRS